MKELSIEEKAKRYDEALERAKGVIEQNPLMEYLKKGIEYIFLELRESEDERIRKALMQNLKERFGIKGNMGEGLDMPDVLDWFEKQADKDKLIKELGEYKVKYTQEVLSLQLEKHSGQKPAWSEDDELHVNSLSKRLEGLCRKEFAMTRFAINEDEDWLKSLKDRVQPKQEWGEEDKEIIQNLLSLWKEVMIEPTCCRFGLHKDEIVDWLKSLRPQSKQEWSEEDKRNLLGVKCIIGEVWHNQYAREEIDHSGEELESLWHWLNSLWNRVEYPQNTWKPSDEQIQAVKEAACYSSVFSEKTIDSMISLSEQLKKLREE